MVASKNFENEGRGDGFGIPKAYPRVQ